MPPPPPPSPSAAPTPRRAGASLAAGRTLRVLAALLLLVGASITAVTGGLATSWALSRSLLDELDVLSGRFFSALRNREQLLVALTGCEDHGPTARLLAAWPPDAGVDVACVMSEAALADDPNATFVADAHDVRVIPVHADGWAAAWGAALAVFQDELYEGLLMTQSDVLLPPAALAALKAALRAAPHVDVLLPVVATSWALGAADGLRPPQGGGGFPGWVAHALGRAGLGERECLQPASGAPLGLHTRRSRERLPLPQASGARRAAPAHLAPPATSPPPPPPHAHRAAPRPHPLLSYQLLTRAHPWLPAPLRANVSGQAPAVQRALLDVHLPGSDAVPPPVVELPSAGGAQYVFTEPLSIAVGRLFVDRHGEALQAAGLVRLAPLQHAALHAQDGGGGRRRRRRRGGGL